ncbi:hypothetical protein [Echinicola sp. 20G]|uniref:hypothetical protein n=1 Tax=Echinicola sp. 20G TaxID=2781961 RepID=UPI0019107DE6|nr:hypothetical protein [Echinicola sp. 20G]
MAKKDTNKKKLRRSQRRLIRFFAITLFSLVFLQVGLYFGSDLLLRSYVQNKVDEASKGKYEVNFDRFNLSIFQRGFYFKGFTLEPTAAYRDSADQKAIYNVQVPEIGVKGIGYSFNKEVLTIGSIRFVKPSMQTKQEFSDLDSIQSSKFDQFQEDIKKSLAKVNLTEIIIQDLFIDQADLLIENFVSQKSIKAEETNFHLKEVLLLNPRPKPTPFNALGFDFSLDNFELLLSDSVHTLKAVEIEVSSLDNHLRAKQVTLTPDLSKKQDIYYSMKLQDLELTEADINQVFYTSDVEVGGLKLERPEFLVYSELSSQAGEKTIDGYDLYPLIEDILASISIDSLEIKEGRFLQRGIENEYKNRIEAGQIDFEMNQVYIGPDEEKKKGQFFYAENAELSLSTVKVVLADDVHWITGDKVYVSSYNDSVMVVGAKVEPFREVEEDITLFRVAIPEFGLEKANLKKVYNESVLDIKEMVLRNPSVQFENIQKKSAGGMEGQTIKELTKDYLKAIYIEKLALIDGDMVLNNKLKINKDSISFRKASMILENFAVDEAIEQDSTSRVFLAEALQLELDGYAMKLTDDLHLFRADKIFVDTKEKFLKIEGFSFEPLQPDRIAENLQKLGKRTVMEVHVPEFYIRGVDIPKAYFDGILEVGQVEIPSPDIKLSRYMARPESQDKVEINDLYDLATSYFSYVRIDSVNVIEGSIGYDNFVRDRIQTFAENDVSIRVKKFLVDKNVPPREAETFFAEELDISLNNYVFNLANGKYTMRADRISYNSSSDELITSNVQLRPRRDLGVKVAIGADVPTLSFKGVDMERFLFENTLSMTKVRLADAEVNLYIDRGTESDSSGRRRPARRSRNLPKTLDVISIDTIEASNATFNAIHSNEGEERSLISTGVNLSFLGFLLDSAKLSQGDIVGFFNNMAIEIDDFNLALSDSVHTLSFNKVELDTKSEEIQFDNLRVTPLTLKGKPGKPIIEAFIPNVTLRTTSLTSFQETGDFDIQQLVLNQPDISLYLDKKGVETATKKKDKQVVQEVVQSLKIDDFKLEGGKLRIKEKEDSTGRQQSYEGLSVALRDLSFDLSQASGFDKHIFLNKDFLVELPNYELKLPDSLNTLKVGLVMLSNDKMVLKDVTLMPRYGQYEYVRKVGSQTDVVKVKLPEIVFDGIDIEELMDGREILANQMLVKSPDIHVFRDKRVPFNEEIYRPMPQKLMQSSGIKMELDCLKVENGRVVYEEFPEKGMVPGSIQFDSLQAFIAPLHLSKKEGDSFGIEESTLEASALINNSAPIDLKAVLYYEEPYPMDLEVSVGEFDLRSINTILERNAFLRIREGMARPSTWSIHADENVATGKMKFYYNGLKVQLLNDRTLEKARGRKAMLNFVLNAFAVRGNNPRKLFNRFVESNIYFERDTSKFIFNYWWKTSLSGFKGSLGLGEAGPEKKDKKQE